LSKYDSLNLDVIKVIFNVKHVSFVIPHAFWGHLGHEGFCFTIADKN